MNLQHPVEVNNPPVKLRPIEFPAVYNSRAYASIIVEGFAREYRIGVREIYDGCKRKDVLEARQNAMALTRRFATKASLETIGRYFGGRDHATVLNACRRRQHVLDAVAATNPASLSEWITRMRVVSMTAGEAYKKRRK